MAATPTLGIWAVMVVPNHFFIVPSMTETNHPHVSLLEAAVISIGK